MKCVTLWKLFMISLLLMDKRGETVLNWFTFTGQGSTFSKWLISYVWRPAKNHFFFLLFAYQSFVLEGTRRDYARLQICLNLFAVRKVQNITDQFISTFVGLVLTKYLKGMKTWKSGLLRDTFTKTRKSYLPFLEHGLQFFISYNLLKTSSQCVM